MEVVVTKALVETQVEAERVAEATPEEGTAEVAREEAAGKVGVVEKVAVSLEGVWRVEAREEVERAEVEVMVEAKGEAERAEVEVMAVAERVEAKGEAERAEVEATAVVREEAERAEGEAMVEDWEVAERVAMTEVAVVMVVEKGGGVAATAKTMGVGPEAKALEEEVVEETQVEA